MLVAERRLELRDGVVRPRRRPDDARHPGDADRADRGAPRRARPRRPEPAPRRRGARPELHAGRPRRGLGRRRVGARAAAAVARPAGASSPRPPDPRSPERGQYAFVQALIREVAYNTLARRDRRDRHLAAARYFEALGSDELRVRSRATTSPPHENAAEGPEADALAAQARIALRAAAERAAALGSHAQAVGLFEQAALVTTDTADLADLARAREAASILLLADYDGAATRAVRARGAPRAARRPACARPPGGLRGSCTAEREARGRVAGDARGGRRRVRRPRRDPRARRGSGPARTGLLPRRGPPAGDRDGGPRPRDGRACRPHPAARRHAGDQGLGPRLAREGRTRPPPSWKPGASLRRRPA